MLKLISLGKKEKKNDFESDAMKATYEVIHNTDQFKTTLTQNLDVTICERTGKVTGELHIIKLEAATMPEAMAKLAIWCERMAMALREPMKVTASVPVFERDYSMDETSRRFEQGGLTLARLKALANGKGISSADARIALQELYDKELISYPVVDVAYLPGDRDWAAEQILESIEQVFPGVTKGVKLREDAPVFVMPFPYAHHAIVPTNERPSGGADFFKLSETVRTIYRIVAEEFVRAISEPPGGEPASEVANA